MGILRQWNWCSCCFLFLLHQFFQKVLGWNISFADNYLDTLLCMPIMLGFLLMERRFLLGKDRTYCFPFFDTLVMVLLLSVVYEEVFPMVSNGFTKDYYDYLCYSIGGLFFYFFINHPHKLSIENRLN